jgi:LDH2 family malate/lactate/ureidoglycolate dehydrogenase
MIVTPDENNAQSITVAFLTPQESGVYSHGIEKMTATGNQIPIVAGTLTLNDDVVQPSDWSS